MEHKRTDNLSEIKKFIRTIKRRKKAIIITCCSVFLIAALVTASLPSMYKSTATILVESQDVEEGLIQRSGTGFIEERIKSISQVVLSRARLSQMIEEIDPYPELRATHTPDEMAEVMKKNIEIEPIQAEVVNPHTGRGMLATVAFSIHFISRDPKKAAEVADKLASAYLKENIQSREQKARKTVDFLRVQADQIKDEIHEIEAKLAVFKQQHFNELPEMVNLNMETAERIEKEIGGLEEQVRSLENRKVFLEGQQATIDPGLYGVGGDGRRLLSRGEELESLRREYISMKSSYSSTHPDMMRLKSRIEALESEYGIREDILGLTRNLEEMKRERAALLKKYTPQHPDVIAAQRQIDELDGRIRTAREQEPVFNPSTQKPTNPAYINIQTQVTATDLEISETKNEIASLKKRLEMYRSRLENSPKVEQEYKVLTLEYDNARDRYRDTISRLRSAREAMYLETSNMSEKMTLLSAPVIPDEPDSPNRLAYLLTGLVFALGCGLGMGTLRDFLDGTVHNPDELGSIGQVPVFSGVPYLTTTYEQRMMRIRKGAIGIGTFLFIASFLSVIHFYILPLNQIIIP